MSEKRHKIGNYQDWMSLHKELVGDRPCSCSWYMYPDKIYKFDDACFHPIKAMWNERNGNDEGEAVYSES